MQRALCVVQAKTAHSVSVVFLLQRQCPLVNALKVVFLSRPRRGVNQLVCPCCLVKRDRIQKRCKFANTQPLFSSSPPSSPCVCACFNHSCIDHLNDSIVDKNLSFLSLLSERHNTHNNPNATSCCSLVPLDFCVVCAVMLTSLCSLVFLCIVLS